jgi:alkanesulfonate monooxygenase SsuD/methylene tetrahydromethanopterin reductase-like flavin-dependent oxidoreductase (luciferase family)
MNFALLQEAHFPAGVSLEQRYREMVEEAVLAEECGFHVYALSEQHFGYSPNWPPERVGPVSRATVSAPEVFLTYVAARTSRIRLRTTSTVLLRFNHPVRVAERLNTLDVLSGGRAELGTARSNNVATMEAFGVDPTETRAQWTESLELIVKALARDPFSHEGQFWTMGERTLTPASVQEPYPPIYVSASGPETHGIAGEVGIGAMTGASVLGWPHVEKCVEAYRTAIAAPSRPVGPQVTNSLGFTVLIAHCADSIAEAEAEVGEFAHDFLERMLGPGGIYEKLVQASPDYAYLDQMKEIQDRRHDLEFVLDHAPYAALGPPDVLIERFRRVEALGYNEILLRIDGMTHDAVCRSIEAIGRYVIPAFSSSPSSAASLSVSP